MSDVKFHRYRLPSLKGEGWAEVVLTEDGFFAAVSDYGNYAYHWTSMGVGDLRLFLLDCDGDYIRRKLDPSMVFNAERTVKNCRNVVGAAYRHAGNPRGTMDKEAVQDALESLKDVDSEYDFVHWLDDYARFFDDYYDLESRRPPDEIMYFVKLVLPRLQEAIRSELSEEEKKQAVTP